MSLAGISGLKRRLRAGTRQPLQTDDSLQKRKAAQISGDPWPQPQAPQRGGGNDQKPSL